MADWNDIIPSHTTVVLTERVTVGKLSTSIHFFTFWHYNSHSKGVNSFFNKSKSEQCQCWINMDNSISEF